ncbi:hypothetical protein [Salinigranum salinum]|uniref:hypothetical protein n=1 Tax=Salinigranum salinum TaxID=1364937 RepID=UPI001260C2C5|nr:hypothetical protein [Salinigranum salinum]
MTARPLSTGVLVLLIVLGVGAGAAVADTPTLDVTVEKTNVTSGDELSFRQNPSMEITTTAADEIETVAVRVNGETTRSFSPDSTEFTTEFVVSLENNEANDVEVLVRDSAGGVESTQFTLIKDGVGPFVGFDSPFQTEVQSRPPDSVSESSSSLTISGTLSDLSGVKTVTIERRHRYEQVGEIRVAARSHQIRDPGDTFSQNVSVGYGENDIEFTMTDTLGNTRSYEFEIVVVDRTDPTLTVDELPTTVRSSSVVLSGSASDNTQIDRIDYTVENRIGSASLVTSNGPAVDSERRSVSFDRRIPLNPGENTVRVSATDVAGNTVTEEFTVVYNDSVVPEMSFSDVTWHNGSVHVQGSVQFGSYQRVSVETAPRGSDETIDFKQLYDGESTGQNLTIDEQLAAADGSDTTILLRVVDVDGEEHIRSATVEPPGTETVEPRTETAVQTDTGESTTTSSDADSNGDGRESGADAQTALDDTDADTGVGDADESRPRPPEPVQIPGVVIGLAAVVIVAVYLYVRR